MSQTRFSDAISPRFRRGSPSCARSCVSHLKRLWVLVSSLPAGELLLPGLLFPLPVLLFLLPGLAVFVSKQAHCLYDILARWQTGEWQVEVPLIVSNHTDLEPVAKHFGIDYHVIPIKPDNKKNQEQRELELLKKYKIDFVVLARYMQILTGEFIRHYPNQIINIHHSFLPAFPGSRPYHSAYDRGVKVIGASSHYITEELDAGPIIEQDVVHVSHKDSVADLIRKGQDLEKVVLARSVWYHLQRQILVYENRTVNFA